MNKFEKIVKTKITLCDKNEIRVGSIVRVASPSRIYSTYSSLADYLNLNYYESGYACPTGSIGIVTGISFHNFAENDKMLENMFIDFNGEDEQKNKIIVSVSLYDEKKKIKDILISSVGVVKTDKKDWIEKSDNWLDDYFRLNNYLFTVIQKSCPGVSFAEFEKGITEKLTNSEVINKILEVPEVDFSKDKKIEEVYRYTNDPPTLPIVIKEYTNYGFLKCSCNAWRMMNSDPKSQSGVPCGHIIKYLQSKNKNISAKSLKVYDKYINTQAKILDISQRLDAVDKIFSDASPKTEIKTKEEKKIFTGYSGYTGSA